MCSVRRISHAPHTSTQSPRRLTLSTTTSTTTAVSVTSTASAGAGYTRSGNAYAVQLQRETEAMLRQMKPTPPQTLPTTTLRTFTCRSVCLSMLHVCLSVCYITSYCQSRNNSLGCAECRENVYHTDGGHCRRTYSCMRRRRLIFCR